MINPSVSKAIEIKDTKQFDELKKKAGGKPLVVDFAATWCPPCQFMKEPFENLAKKFSGRAVFLKCDVDELPDLAA